MENEKKPKKRSLRLLSVFTVVLLLAFMAVPAFAAESDEVNAVGFNWEFNDVLSFPSFLEDTYSVPVNFSVYHDIDASTAQAIKDQLAAEGIQADFVVQDYSFVCNYSEFDFYLNNDPDEFYFILNFNNPVVSVSPYDPVVAQLAPALLFNGMEAYHSQFGWGHPWYRSIDFGSVSQSVPDEFYNWLVSNAVPENSFRDSVTSGLTVVIDWVGTVVSSLFSGELSGLLPIVAIPVAVTLLVLAIYFIRRSIWGA